MPCVTSDHVPGGLSNSIVREKVGQIFFFTGKFAFFSKKVCFQQPFRSYRNKLITCVKFVNILDLYKVFVDIFRVWCHEKNGPQYFFYWKVCFFSRFFVFNNLLGVARKKWSYNFHSFCQITFCTLTNRPLRFLKLDNRKKK